nr:f2.1 [Tranosema rostrale ichnovirus]
MAKTADKTPQSRPNVDSIRLKKIMSRITAGAAKNVLDSKTCETNNIEQIVDAGASEKEIPTPMLVPKKRPYVEPAAESNSGKETFAMKKDTISATGGPVMKKRRRDVKEQQQKVLPLQARNEVPSGSLAVRPRVHVRPQGNVPPINQTSTETSAKSSSALNSTDRHFCNDTTANDCDSLDFNVLLKNSQFTEELANALQQTFYQLSLKHLLFLQTVEFYENAQVLGCEFSISHQCTSIDLSNTCRLALTMHLNYFVPNPIMCTCQFGFVHSHVTRTRSMQGQNLNLKNIPYLLEHHRSTSLSCPRCHIHIVMKNREKDVCSDLNNWVGLRMRPQTVLNFLRHRLRQSTISWPMLNELYTCSKKCCLLFHRCAEEAITDNTTNVQSNQTPMTTSTRTLVSR